jgi:hypothetical protein
MDFLTPLGPSFSPFSGWAGPGGGAPTGSTGMGPGVALSAEAELGRDMREG